MKNQFDGMSANDLQAGITDYLRNPGAADSAAEHEAAKAAKSAPIDAAELARDAVVRSLMAKPTAQLSPAEQAMLQAEVLKVLQSKS